MKDKKYFYRNMRVFLPEITLCVGYDKVLQGSSIISRWSIVQCSRHYTTQLLLRCVKAITDGYSKK